jgi:DNA-binding PadR family transcriptional regulator
MMTKARAELTELEGAILGVLRRTGGSTAYHVRQVFLASRSAEWSGSAGAVYPAIARLKKSGLLAERARKDGRGTKICAITAKGEAAHEAWFCDVARATGAGLDPFRLRAGFWRDLVPGEQRALAQRLRNALKQQRDELRAARELGDPVDAVSRELHDALLQTRLVWLDKFSS